MSSQIVRQIILPELEKEVNTGKNFANLRQIFNSIILSSWYKRNLKEALLNQVYANKSKVKGINLKDPTVKQQIYEQYLKLIRRVYLTILRKIQCYGQTIPRKYFSGGVNPGMAARPEVIIDSAQGAQELEESSNSDPLMDFATLASPQRPKFKVSNPDAAMNVGQMKDLIRNLVFQKRMLIHTFTHRFQDQLLRNNGTIKKILNEDNREDPELALFRYVLAMSLGFIP